MCVRAVVRLYTPRRSSSMWTWFIRALMGRRIDDHLSDTGTETYEGCIASLRNAKEHPDESNTTLADVKRCKKAIPKLLGLHRTPEPTPRAAPPS